MLFTIMASITFLCSLAGLYLLFKGTTITERIIGLDYLFAIGIVFCLLSAWLNQNTLYIDIAIGLALTGFIATLSWAKLIENSTETLEDKQ